MKTLREIMSERPATVGPQTSMYEALSLMDALPCRHLPVVEDGRVVGIVSERDLLHRDVGLSAPVSSCMTGQILYLDAGRPVSEAIGVMLEFRVSSIPVTDGTHLVGIVTTTDLLRYLAEILAATA